MVHVDRITRLASIGQRVAGVVAIIGRDKARVDIIKEAIRALDARQRPNTELWPWPPMPLNKRDKTIARSLGLAIGKLEKRLRHPDTPGVLLRATYGEHNVFLEWQAQLKHWRERFEAFGGKAQREPNDFENSPKTWPLGRRNRSADRLVRKHSAAAMAAEILESHGLRPTATQKSHTKKASVFCRIAAVLYGDPRADLYHQCRGFIETRNKVSK